MERSKEDQAKIEELREMLEGSLIGQPSSQPQLMSESNANAGPAFAQAAQAEAHQQAPPLSTHVKEADPSGQQEWAVSDLETRSIHYLSVPEAAAGEQQQESNAYSTGFKPSYSTG